MAKSSVEYKTYKKVMRQFGESPDTGVTELVNLVGDIVDAVEKGKIPRSAGAAEIKNLRALLKALEVPGKVCARCGGTVYLSDLPQYPFVCPCCDENKFLFEVVDVNPVECIG